MKTFEEDISGPDLGYLVSMARSSDFLTKEQFETSKTRLQEKDLEKLADEVYFALKNNHNHATLSKKAKEIICLAFQD